MLLCIRYDNGEILPIPDFCIMAKGSWGMHVSEQGGAARVLFMFTDQTEFKMQDFDGGFEGRIIMELNAMHVVNVKCLDKTFKFYFAIMDESSPLSPHEGPTITLTLRQSQPFQTNNCPTSPSYTPDSPCCCPTSPSYTPDSPSYTPLSLCLDAPTTSPLFRPRASSPKQSVQVMPTLDLAALSSYGPSPKQRLNKRRAFPYIPTRFGAVGFRRGHIFLKSCV